MAQIFISYRRSETGYVAAMLADELKAQFGENSVFMDVDNIPLGVDFRDHIGAAVSECQVLLALIGDDWLTSTLPDGTRRIDAPGDFVRVEIEAALDRKIPVIPIMTGEANVPGEQDLPASLRPLAFRNAAELRAGRDLRTQLQVLMNQLSEMLPEADSNSRAATRHAPSPIPRRRRRNRRRRVLFIALGAAAVLATLGTFFYAGRSLQSPQPPTASIREVTLQTKDGTPIALHKSPDAHSEKTGALRRGSSVLVVDTTRGADGKTWSKVSINPGWLAARNLHDPDFLMLRPVNTSALLPRHPAVVSYTGSDGLNLRESPNLQSAVIAVLLAETQVMITSDNLLTPDYEWWPVEVAGAWIATDEVILQERR